jgi:hypothetical protein
MHSPALDARGAEAAARPETPKKPRGAPTDAAPSAKGKLSPVEFMQVRAKLKAELTKTIASAKRKSSVFILIKQSRAKLTPDQLTGLDKDPSLIIKTLEDAVKGISTIVDDLESLKLSGLEAMQNRANFATTALDDAETEAGEHLEAMNFLISEKTKEVKATGDHHRYVRSKVQSRMLTAGWTKTFAESFVTRLDNKPDITANLDSFTPTSVQLWTHESEVGKAMLDKIKDYRAKATMNIEDRRGILAKSLEQKPQWLGCVTRVDHGEHKFDDWGFPEKPIGLDDVGTSPWLICMRQFAWRYGPHSWPMPGLGCFVQNLSEECLEVYMIMPPVTAAIEQGISVKDMQAFLETGSGQTLFTKEGIIVKLPAGPDAVMWVPYGYVAVPIAFVDPQADEKQQKEHSNKVAFLWCWTPFVPCMATRIDDQTLTWTAIVAWNRDHMAKNSTQTIWADRSKWFGEFLLRVRRTT